MKSSAGTRTVIGGTNGSEISFGVSEDLGNGLKAIASTTLCANITEGSVPNTCGGAAAGSTIKSTASGTAVAAQSGAVNNYNSYVGLSSAEVGTVKIGQQFSNTFFAAATGDVFGMSGLSNYRAAGAGAGQVANSLSYVSPSFSGFSIAYQQSLDTQTTTVGSTNYAVNYNNGGLNASIASSKLSNDTAREIVIGANYNFGVATVFAGSKTKTGVKTSTGYGVAVPFGAFTFAAGVSSGVANDKAASGVTAADNAAKADLGTTEFAISYNLSKRTSIYGGQVTTDTAPTATVIGVRHNF